MTGETFSFCENQVLVIQEKKKFEKCETTVYNYKNNIVLMGEES